MGIFHNLIETYDKCTDAIGLSYFDEEGVKNEKKTLLPIFHTTLKSEIDITIDNNGCFVNASKDPKVTIIIVPCTEKSEGRSSGVAAYPLCDQIDYIGALNLDKLEAYLLGLSAWKDDNIELNAIYNYVAGETLINDLIGQGIFKESDYKAPKNGVEEKTLDYEKIRKIGVRFSIKNGTQVMKVWESEELRDKWINHVLSDAPIDEGFFDYFSGENIVQIASQHPKNINSFTGNAKLLSCNDTSGFTFRGRFAEQDDAIMIDYVQSQKMHQMLRWLIANHGYYVDTQVIVTWAVDTNTEVNVKSQDNSLDSYLEMEGTKIDAEILTEMSGEVYTDYAKKMKNLLKGYGNAENIKQHSRKICIAIFDAATTGRMGLVFYQELSEGEYLENIVDWHNDTSYHLSAWKKGKSDNGEGPSMLIRYIGAPSFDDILFAAYGRARGDKSYDILKKKTRKQLLECMFGNFAFPKNMVEMSANRASRPMSFTDSNGKFSENDWKRAINISCALARKYYKEQKEEIQLELDTNRTDRDYLFGRLLSVADRLERSALYKADKQDSRATNATRLMSAFQIKPYSTWGQLYTQLIPYKNQLNGAGYYQSMIDNIMSLFEDGEYENNSPLSPLYLLGYSAQNRALSQKNKNDNLEGKDNVDTTK